MRSASAASLAWLTSPSAYFCCAPHSWRRGTPGHQVQAQPRGSRRLSPETAATFQLDFGPTSVWRHAPRWAMQCCRPKPRPLVQFEFSCFPPMSPTKGGDGTGCQAPPPSGIRRQPIGQFCLTSRRGSSSCEGTAEPFFLCDLAPLASTIRGDGRLGGARRSGGDVRDTERRPPPSLARGRDDVVHLMPLMNSE